MCLIIQADILTKALICVWIVGWMMISRLCGGVAIRAGRRMRQLETQGKWLECITLKGHKYMLMEPVRPDYCAHSLVKIGLWKVATLGKICPNPAHVPQLFLSFCNSCAGCFVWRWIDSTLLSRMWAQWAVGITASESCPIVSLSLWGTKWGILIQGSCHCMGYHGTIHLILPDLLMF